MTQSPTHIHKAVREHYAERIKNATLSTKQSKDNASCCGPLQQAQGDADNCCGPENNLYPEDLLATLPEGESAVSYGCGDPVTLASLQPGQTVLDLGSGAGLDCFFAAKKVGEAGKVIGVDMTPEMVARARSSAKRMNLSNVEFRQGYIEDLPVESNSVDVIISNCVINLSPDKAQVFREAYRALKPGGKLAVSDIVTDGPLPERFKSNLSAWAGCVAGALELQDYIAALEAAGFVDVRYSPEYFPPALVDQAVDELGEAFSPEERAGTSIYQAVFSARISAQKPR